MPRLFRATSFLATLRRSSSPVSRVASPPVLNYRVGSPTRGPTKDAVQKRPGPLQQVLMLRALSLIGQAGLISLVLSFNAAPVHACQPYPGQEWGGGATLIIVANVLSISSDTSTVVVSPTEVLRGTPGAPTVTVRYGDMMFGPYESPVGQPYTLYLYSDGPGKAAFSHCLPVRAGGATDLERAALSGASPEVLAPLQRAEAERSLRAYITSSYEYLAQERMTAAISRHTGRIHDAVRQELAADQLERDIASLAATYRTQGYTIPEFNRSLEDRRKAALELRLEIMLERVNTPYAHP